MTVSTSHSRFVEELLRRELARASGRADADVPLHSVLRFVQRFAPGLAMRCLGRPDGLGPEGILGLLLTAQHAERTGPGAISLPLDEHGWVYGRRGIRADVLVVAPRADGIGLRVLESKYSKDAPDRVSPRAREQVERSADALRGWLKLPEIGAYFRRRLRDAVLAHAAGDIAREDLARRIMNGATCITVDHHAEAHIWVWGATVPATDKTIGDVHVLVHLPSDTRNALRHLIAGSQ